MFDCFTENVQKEGASLRNYAYQLTRNTDDADDLVQETVLKALLYQDKFIEGTNLKGWLYTIMKNSFINNYRRMVKRNSFIDSNDSVIHEHNTVAFAGNDAENQFIKNDLAAAVDMLPDGLKKPFTMNNCGFKYHEIAEILHIPIGTVKTRIFVARRRLRDHLAGYSEMKVSA